MATAKGRFRERRGYDTTEKIVNGPLVQFYVVHDRTHGKALRVPVNSSLLLYEFNIYTASIVSNRIAREFKTNGL